MPIFRIFLPTSLIAALATVGCAHDEEARGGITTLRSGVPEGPRVTNVATDDRKTRLAVELCRRAEACGHVGERTQRWPSENACVSEVERDLPAQLGAWTCPPETSRAGFDDCLAAIRSSRCGPPADDRWSELAACRAEAVCPSR